ncbi:hypothetical protein [Flavobacterium rhizosphaerae]|uniref:PepSY-associated TM region n=1 Tax=Flavobacterium rhizosphaerae TaxID=3163298 RepID=A0ABW8YT76_9FLAO
MKFNHRMRIWHRYLGFFLAGIMAVYALSGIILIFRKESIFKKEVTEERTIAPGLTPDALGPALRIRDFKVEKTEGSLIYFKDGTYDKSNGHAVYKTLQYPYVIDKMTQLHKANSGQPLFFLNVFFGVGLLFFVVSSFVMFLPKTVIFKRGIYIALAGLVLALILIFV